MQEETSEVDPNQTLINSHLYHLGNYNDITSKLQQLLEIDREGNYNEMYDKIQELVEQVEIEENLLHRAIDKLS